MSFRKRKEQCSENWLKKREGNSRKDKDENLKW